MYSFTPKKTNNTASALIGVLLVAAAVAFLFPALSRDMQYAGILQSLGLVFIIAALAVMSRYSFKYFTYEVRENNGQSPDLDVVETQGKRRYTVCRVSLSNIESVERMTEKNKDALKAKCNGRKKFSYLADIAPKDALFVFVTECGEPLALILAYDETLEKLLATKKD